jgi:hypothetical protein
MSLEEEDPAKLESAVAVAINAAEEVAGQQVDATQKPRLLIEPSSPDRTLAALRDILARAPIYERGSPVRVVRDQTVGGMVAQEITPDGLVLLAHQMCRPHEWKMKNGDLVDTDVRLPHYLARMYLGWRGEWRLSLLNGIATSPLLHEDGSIHSHEGYDAESEMWCEALPGIADLVPARPTRHEAVAAVSRIRETFKTFPFADADMVDNPCGYGVVVDTSKPPGRDESSFLVSLLTAVCRPSLYLAPGVLLRAPAISGAGAGKGLLARCTCMIAFGRQPHAVTAGANAEELEKRIAAELIGGGPVLFLDNLNNTAFKSDLLASAITERPARVRILGRSQMVPLNVSAFVVLTGNALSVSEDLARRFVVVELDARTEDPEARRFTTDILVEVRRRRTELLVDLLTIWRWGTSADLPEGLPLGSFDQWCRWVRDPLMALGCQDPVARVSEAKERDGRRQALVEAFTIWWEKHGDRPVAVRQLDEAVIHALDPQGRNRQFLAARLEKLAGTRMAGFVLTRQASPGKWGAATYALKKTMGEDHRDHRGHRAVGAPKSGSDAPDGPYAPYANRDCAENQYSQPQPSCASSCADTPSNEPPGWEGRV